MAAPVTLEFLGHLMQRALDRLDTVVDRLDTMEGRIRMLDARQARVDSSLATIIDELHGIGRVIDRQEKRIGKLEDQRVP